MVNTSGPQPWSAADVEKDCSWILQMTPEEAEGFHTALKAAKKNPKPLLAMTQADYPLPAASVNALKRAIGTTQERWGMCLLKGFPTDLWTEEDMRVAYWGMGLYMGVGRTQNKQSEMINNVRDAGGSYKAKGGRGYNTNAELDWHQDSCDIVTLLTRRIAKSGGRSKVVSSIYLRDKIAKIRPDLLPVLRANNWYHSFQGAQDPIQPGYYRCPIISDQEGTPFCARTNRKNIVAAQRDFPEVPRLTPQQEEALDLMDELMASDDMCFSMELEKGDLQLLNNFVILHSRSQFADFEVPDMKRHLMRLWLSIPESQPLPETWEEYWGDHRAGSVRGGVRGSAISDEFKAYEKKHAEVMGMKFKAWDPKIKQGDMEKILKGA